MRESLELLKLVSRSFYLTIRALPRPLREPIGLAYLLARATDTIADTVQAPVEIRLEELRTLARSIQGAHHKPLSGTIRPAHEGEMLLLSQVDDCLEALRETPVPLRMEIKTVLGRIIRGQELDLLRFERDFTGIQTAEELEEYTFLVAGCVGEFWTRVCMHKGVKISDPERMCALGVRFGKGLQLVNILRDIPADLKSGRCYLPKTELIEIGADLRTLAGAEPVYAKWLERAYEQMEAAYEYIAALPPGRVRYACILPWRLGVLTLRKIESIPPWKQQERIKVSRKEVRGTCLRGLMAAVSDASLKRLK